MNNDVKKNITVCNTSNFDCNVAVIEQENMNWWNNNDSLNPQQIITYM